MKKFLTQIGKLVFLAIAGVIYASAIALFLDPNDMAPGGVTGVAVIINRLTGMETGTLIFIFNIPIIIFGACKFGVRFILTTVYTLYVMSAATNILSAYGTVITHDRILAAFIGGSLMGIGIGMAFRLGSTTGGMDIIVKVLRRRLPYIKSGQIFLMMDAVIIAASAIVFKNVEVALYAAIAVFVSSVVMDKVLYGADGGKLVYIISSNPEQIAERLLKEVVAGVTYVDGEGAYEKKDKKIILCVVRKQSLPKLKEIVKEEDLGAFMFVSPATEVFGEGYKRYDSEEV